MPPDTENWIKLQELFHLIDGTPEADWERVLAEACPDPELRARVIAVVRSGKNSDTASSAQTQVRVPLRTESIGPYTVVRPIGSGGMGSVFLVEREVGGVRQRSALKILAPHAAGPSFVDRFYREERILASLEHPNITRMLDAGISED